MEGREAAQSVLQDISLSDASQEPVKESSSAGLGKLLDDQQRGEGESIVYSFYDPNVRRRLMKLIKTDVVRIMDKKFMINLQDKLYQSYFEDFEERLQQRRKREAERRKKLALRGVQPLDDNSLDQNPIMVVARRVEGEMEAFRKKNKRPHYKPRVDPWEYRQFQTLSDMDTEASEVSRISEEIRDLDWVRSSRLKYAKLAEEGVQIGILPKQEIIDNLKYEPPLVKELRKLHKVDELYELAELILQAEEERAPAVEPGAEEAKEAKEVIQAAEEEPPKKGGKKQAKEAKVGKKQAKEAKVGKKGKKK